MQRRRRYVARILAVLLAVLLVPASGYARASSGFLPTREHDGVCYEARPPAELTTILLIGYDHQAYGMEEELHGYSGGGQADFLMLVVMDHQQEQVRLLQIDRDTMTGVKVTDYKGNQRSARLLQICLAHAYGDTREKNNANTVWSVENLLGIAEKNDGAQVDWYMAMDISGISRLNDLLGGVTVTITDDMTAFDPAMAAGATLRLTGKQAEIFCRSRYGVGDQTNASRMQRQRLYMTAAGQQLAALIREDAGFASQLLNGMGVIHDSAVDSDNPFARTDGGTPSGNAQGKYLMSSETVSGIVNVLSRAIYYEVLPVETLSGVHTRGTDGYIRFEPEEGAALEWALSVFYRVME